MKKTLFKKILEQEYTDKQTNALCQSINQCSTHCTDTDIGLHILLVEKNVASFWYWEGGVIDNRIEIFDPFLVATVVCR